MGRNLEVVKVQWFQFLVRKIVYEIKKKSSSRLHDTCPLGNLSLKMPDILPSLLEILNQVLITVSENPQARGEAIMVGEAVEEPRYLPWNNWRWFADSNETRQTERMEALHVSPCSLHVAHNCFRDCEYLVNEGLLSIMCQSTI